MPNPDGTDERGTAARHRCLMSDDSRRVGMIHYAAAVFAVKPVLTLKLRDRKPVFSVPLLATACIQIEVFYHQAFLCNRKPWFLARKPTYVFYRGTDVFSITLKERNTSSI